MKNPWQLGLVAASLALVAGCNSALLHGVATALEATPNPAHWRYEPAHTPPLEPEHAARLLARFAPAFVLEAGEAEWNRIGTPVLHRRAGIERARVDPTRPALFAEVHEERVGARILDQLVYRIHFDQFALTGSAPLALHRNAGLLVLVSVDRETGRALCLSSVHTCGCWLAVQPTRALARGALPVDWPNEWLEVGGERLRPELDPPSEGERFVLHLRAGSHRVRAVSVEGAVPGALALPLRAMADLRRLPVEGRSGEYGSFFYEAGYLQGYVKGAFAPLEGLTLGLLTLDPRLGMDRDFGDPRETGARFFTALAPWRRERTRLDRFENALAERGFRVEAFAPTGAPQ